MLSIYVAKKPDSYDHVVVNDDLEQSYARFKEIVIKVYWCYKYPYFNMTQLNSCKFETANCGVLRWNISTWRCQPMIMPSIREGGGVIYIVLNLYNILYSPTPFRQALQWLYMLVIDMYVLCSSICLLDWNVHCVLFSRISTH